MNIRIILFVLAACTILSTYLLSTTTQVETFISSPAETRTITIALATKYFSRVWKAPNHLLCNITGFDKPCMYSNNMSDTNADALLFHMRDLNYSQLKIMQRGSKRYAQIFMLYSLESAMNEKPLKTDQLDGVFNWTVTYKLNSDIVAPYGRIVPLEEESKDTVNVHRGKTKMALMMVNNCNAHNRRLEYAKALSKHIDVDIFGDCTGKKCPGGWCDNEALGRKYKFYLAFENSICTDYITEKFWSNALKDGMIPVVLGASKADYLKVAPPHSFIHTDDFRNASDLADYLQLLDEHPALYDEYFSWRRFHGLDTRRDTQRDLCLICAALYNSTKLNTPKVYNQGDLKRYWNRNHCAA